MPLIAALSNFVYGPPAAVARYTLYPLTPDDELACHFNATEWLTVVVPMPVAGNVMLAPLVALLAIVIDPDTLPAAFGANVAVNVALWPGASVVPPAIPLKAIPAPLTASLEIVTLEFPALVTVNVFAVDAPTATLPNATLPGETLNNRDVAVPVPLTAIDTELSVAVDAIVTAPLALPALAGWNATVSCALAPAASAYGVVIPETENPLPVVATLEIVTADDPVFVN